MNLILATTLVKSLTRNNTASVYDFKFLPSTIKVKLVLFFTFMEKRKLQKAQMTLQWSIMTAKDLAEITKDVDEG